MTFRITDDGKAALDKDAINTPGIVALNFVLSRINQGDRQYTAYTTRLQPNTTTGQLEICKPTGMSAGPIAAPETAFIHTPSPPKSQAATIPR